MLEKFDAYQVSKRFYWACKDLRLSRLLRDQLLRASSSITLNLAEGSGKRTPNDQSRYYSIALGSLRECQAILDLERIEEKEIRKMADDLGAMLFKLSKKTETETERKQQQQRRTDHGGTPVAE